MIYIFRRAASTGARLLAEALGGRRIRNEANLRPRAGDLVVCWGDIPQQIDGVKYLNAVPIQNKFADAVKLKEAGVPTIEVSRVKPVQLAPVPIDDPAKALHQKVSEWAEDFLNTANWDRGPVYIEGIRTGAIAITDFLMKLQLPIPVAAPQAIGEWLARRNNHVGGNDLLANLQQGEYYVKKEELIKEFRVHTFEGRSIRGGIKSPRDGFGNPHQWIRSWDAGWRISYNGVDLRQRHRDVAHAALKALGLQFGAVDIGERQDGSVIVLEVNRAPGIEGGTITAYANAIRQWNENQ